MSIVDKINVFEQATHAPLKHVCDPDCVHICTASMLFTYHIIDMWHVESHLYFFLNNATADQIAELWIVYGSMHCVCGVIKAGCIKITQSFNDCKGVKGEQIFSNQSILRHIFSATDRHLAIYRIKIGHLIRS